MTRNQTSAPSRDGVATLALLVGVFWVGLQLRCSTLSSYSLHISGDEALAQAPHHPVATNDCQLAYQESFGFFTHIPNDEWKRRRHEARNATFHRYVGHPRRQWDKPHLWYYNNYDPLFSCPHVKRVKGIGDGPKWTCDPHRLVKLAWKRQEESKSNGCLVYSIGSNGNYQWEDGMYEEMMASPSTNGVKSSKSPCEIHIFDFSQNYTRIRNAARNMHFHQWGLQGSGSPSRGKAFKTFPEIVQALGHQHRTIDVFKIDCEGCEWESFGDWIGHDIRQILVETHSLPQNKSLGLEFFDSFVKHNFVMFSKEVNPWGGGKYVEFSYIKLQENFLHGKD